MKFLKTTYDDGEVYRDMLAEIEINTLDELKAFAWGGYGRIEINFCARDLDGEVMDAPTIRLIGVKRDEQA